MRLLTDHHRTALTFGETSWSFARLLEEASRWRILLGDAPGERTLIFAENRLDWIAAFYGSWMRGSVNVPLDAMSGVDEVRHVIRDCRPETVIHSAATRPLLEEALGGLVARPRLVCMDDVDLPGPAGVPEMPEASPDALALIMYTSGTTGGSKGVMLTYDNLLANLEAVTERTGIYTPADRVLVLLPLHHVLPLVGTVVAPLRVGSSLVLSPSLSPQDILATFQAHRITIMVGVPRLYHLFHKAIMEKINARLATRVVFRLVRRIGSRSLARKVFAAVHQRFGGELRHMVCGGAALDTEAHRNFLALGFDLLNGFGLSEAAPMIAFTRPGKGVVGSAGEIIPGGAVRFEDGEILFRGRNVMPGYWERPAETAAAIENGWLRTGDLGRLDRHGNLFITGRKKELLVLSSGKKINPEEIEQGILAMTDAVKEIGVYASGDVLCAIIVPDLERLRERGILNLEEAFRNEILDAYNKRVPSYRRVARFTLVRHELPRTRLGKLRRFMLESFAGTPGSAGGEDSPAPDLPEYEALRGYLAGLAEKPVRPDDHIELDLGLDSLGKVSLIGWVGSVFGIRMTEKDLVDHPTVRSLAEFAATRKTSFRAGSADWGELLTEAEAEGAEELPRSGVLHVLLRLATKLAMRLYFRIRVRGMANLPEPPFIIAPNHQSVADGLLVGNYLPLRKLRRTFYFAKEKHFRRRLLRYLARRSNIITMNIDLDLRGALRKMAEVLRRGNGVIVFPEGTRTRDGSLGSFKKTFAVLSREMDVPVVPVAIVGAWEALPRGSRLPRWMAPIGINFLPPVNPEGLTAEQIRDRVRERIDEFLKAARKAE